MSYFTTNIGDVEIAIMDATPTKSGSRDAFSRPTSATGVNAALGKIENVIDGIEPVLREVAKKGWEVLNTDLVPPDELSMTVGLGYSVEANVWMLGGKSDMTFEVERTWKRKDKPNQ